MAIAFDPIAARAALAELPVLAAHESLEPPALEKVFVPAQHAKALSLDASVVVGMRGAGKSWWTSVLASEPHRRFVSRQLQGTSLAKVVVQVGFGTEDNEKDFPNPDTLNRLLGEGLDPVAIWQTVVLRHALRAIERDLPSAQSSWRDRIRWVVENPDDVNALLTDCDVALSARDRVLLIVFDAFDRLSGEWEKVRTLSTAALALGLRLRSRRALRLKFFIRPDLDEDPSIWSFPDSSKLRQAKVDLAWSSTDLYGLVFMHLGNTKDFGAEFRRNTRQPANDWSQNDDVFIPPLALSRSRDVQQPIVEAIADRHMGANAKRGTTYTWVPLHLADAIGRIGPRSYLLAFKRAAEHTREHRPEHSRALHFTAIQQGVVKASETRVQEIEEDYPWVKPLLEAARGVSVPIEIAELASRWSPDCLRRMNAAIGSKLPPRRYSTDPVREGNLNALVDDLVELAVLYRTSDGRLNMPDIFRVGFGVRRKGGVKPPR